MNANLQYDLDTAREAVEAQTAKLRVMRMMKEANDRAAARLAALTAPPPKAKKPRKKFILG